MPDARALAIALQVRERHAVTPSITCRHCLPPGTPWPCLPFQRAEATIEQLGATSHPPAPVHPDWWGGGSSDG
jgi:hypothetical protein